MISQLVVYTRRDCCLCEDMKAVIHQVAKQMPLVIKEVDVDSSPALQEQYGNEVPVLFISGRKAFKYRVTEKELVRKLRRTTVSNLIPGLGRWR